MDYIDDKSLEDILNIINNIEKYLSLNEYENAFMMFLLHTNRMNSLDRDKLIKYFNKYFKEKYIVNN